MVCILDLHHDHSLDTNSTSDIRIYRQLLLRAKKHLQSTASLHCDHCRAGHSPCSAESLDGTTSGLEGMAPAAAGSELKLIQLAIATPNRASAP